MVEDDRGIYSLCNYSPPNTNIGVFELVGCVMLNRSSDYSSSSSSSERGLRLDNGLVGSLIMLRILDSSSPSVFSLNSVTSASNVSQNVLSPSWKAKYDLNFSKICSALSLITWISFCIFSLAVLSVQLV